MLNKEEFIESLNIADKTTAELESMVELMEARIESVIGIPVNPTNYSYMDYRFEGKIIELPMFPAHEPIELKVNGETIQSDDMVVDFNAGLIYFHSTHQGLLELTYKYGLTTVQYETYVKPLIRDMINYEVTQGWDKNASSIKEGEIQINYDTSISEGALIQSKLLQLKNMFSIRVAMI